MVICGRGCIDRWANATRLSRNAGRPESAGDRAAARAGTVRRNVRARVMAASRCASPSASRLRILSLRRSARVCADRSGANAESATADLHARSGRPVRAGSLSNRPRGARTDQRLDRECQRRAIGIPAAAGFAVAVEPRHRQQHLWPGPAAIGHSRDVRPGAARPHRAAASGEAPSARCSRGSRSISACGGPRSPPPRPRSRARVPARR